jgi:hypothetical protein
MSSDLTELGQKAIAAVSKGVADGAPLVNASCSHPPSMRLCGSSLQVRTSHLRVFDLERTQNG